MFAKAVESAVHLRLIAMKEGGYKFAMSAERIMSYDLQGEECLESCEKGLVPLVYMRNGVLEPGVQCYESRFSLGLLLLVGVFLLLL